MKYRLIFLLAWVSLLGNPLLSQPIDTNQTYYLQDILLDGNSITKDYIILRELEFQPGDTISGASLNYLIERSENNVFNTGLFNSAKIYAYPCENGELDMHILVAERWYVWPLPIVENADRNFNTWWQNRDFGRLSYGLFLTWNNFRGRNEILRLKVQAGFEQQFSAGYAFPFIDKKRRKGLSFGVGYSSNKEVNYASSENRRVFFKDESTNQKEEYAASVSFQFRGKLYSTHTATLGFNLVQISDSIQVRGRDYLYNGQLENQYFAASYQYRFDKRDYIHYPLEGIMFQVRCVKQGLGIGPDDLDLLTFHGTLNHHIPLSKRFYWGNGIRGKYNAGQDPPYYFQRGLGYADFVRGYELYVMDAQHYGLTRSNIKYQLVKPNSRKIDLIPFEKFNTVYYALYLNAFSDIGYAIDDLYAEVNPLSNEWLVGYGLGVDFITYYDVVFRLEYSFNLENESGFFIHFQKPI